MKNHKNNLLIILILIFFAGSFIILANDYSFSPTGMVVKDIDNLDYALSNLETIRLAYNQNIDKVPNFVKTVCGNEKIKAVVTRDNGSKVVLSIETNKAVITQLTDKEFDSYTLEVYCSEKTINDIISSDDQVSSLKKALDSKEIVYKSLRLKTSIKTGISRVFLSLSRMFR